MNAKQLLSIALFTFVLALSVFSWREHATSQRRYEGFADGKEADIMSPEVIKAIKMANEPTISPKEADAAYQTLLRFIRNDYNTGRKFVTDFGIRFFGEDVPIRDDLDVPALMENYHSPLQRV